jgi:hypothetical protein
MRSTPRGSRERVPTKLSTTSDDLFRLRRAAWRVQGVVVLNVDAIENDVERQMLVNVATRLYGPRA